MRTELAIALDTPSRDAANRLLSQLPVDVKWCKVGLELFVASGPRIVSDLVAAGRHVFLDLKFHDIPNTVAGAVRSAARHGVELLTVHAQGGQAMLEAAAQAASEFGSNAPRIVAVTTLTSIGQKDLLQMGVTRSLPSHVLALAEIALKSGIDGMVCSSHEVADLRQKFGSSPILVVPGIRPAGSSLGDQKRVATPADAAKAGASIIVVGRPITSAPDPRAVTDSILAEIGAVGK